MKRSVLKNICLSAGLGLAMLGAVHAAPPFPFFGSKPEASARPAITWQTDLFAAHRLAQQQNKPMLLVFGAEWCGYCKKLESQTLSHPQLADYINQNFIPVHLDADQETRVTKILEVESLPCSIVLSPKADLLGRIDGYYKPEPFHRKLIEARLGQAPTAVSPAKAE